MFKGLGERQGRCELGGKGAGEPGKWSIVAFQNAILEHGMPCLEAFSAEWIMCPK